MLLGLDQSSLLQVSNFVTQGSCNLHQPDVQPHLCPAAASVTQEEALAALQASRRTSTASILQGTAD